MIRKLSDLEKVNWAKVAAGGGIELPPEPVSPPPTVHHLDLSTDLAERDFSSRPDQV